MRFHERADYQYDPEIFRKSDTQTALKIYDEAVRKFSAKPPPRFFEIDRNTQKWDDLWHVPLSPVTQFSRQIDISALNKFVKNDWNLTKLGYVPQRRDRFTLSNLGLQAADYFPNRGDFVWWNGYRYVIVVINLPGEAYWQQTNVWLGLEVECVIPPEGDAKPFLPAVLAEHAPVEQSTSQPSFQAAPESPPLAQPPVWP